ncbi:hypothetical protein BLA50215_05732 [Burkholderia lata]|uniref:hypothetical protein n=1 Tax=Burkholderia lata (strain ATCC 17760 / DSM 23089 / LMG 22485 / NCIMB 9086 / R18194 / 383) TaxID=482957 RepID=UPI001454B728|nr:hypothetical protein [Burkholderia lata]VWD45765.1 hypothetical protein BLA50215_05732 [Burkholderia lata]
MSVLQKINQGTPPSGQDGDTVRTGFAKVNANVDAIAARVPLEYTYLGDTATLRPDHVGYRFGLAMAGPGKVVTLPLVSSVPVNGCIHLFNVGPPVGIGLQGNDGTQVTYLNTGDWAKYVGDGGAYWHVAERGRMMPDEVVSGFLTVSKGLTVGGDVVASGKLSGVNSSNLLINGSGELGNTGWNGTTFGAVQGSYGEGPLFVNSSAINTGTWVVDASNDIPCSPGVPLTLSAEIISMGLNAGRVYVKCEAFKSDGSFIGLVTGTPANTTKLGYTFRSATATTPAGTAFVRVSKVADSAPNIDAYGVAFRRIKLERASGASLYSQEATVGYVGGALAGKLDVGGRKDGVAPAAGNVGQEIASSNLSIVLPGNSTWVTVMSLPLPPGEWDISSTLLFNSNLSAITMTGALVTLSTASGAVNAQCLAAVTGVSTSGFLSLAPSVMRVRTSVGLTVFMNAQGNAGGAGIPCNGYMTARRVAA